MQQTGSSNEEAQRQLQNNAATQRLRATMITPKTLRSAV
jgi:hypothetical protein